MYKKGKIFGCNYSGGPPHGFDFIMACYGPPVLSKGQLWQGPYTSYLNKIEKARPF